MSKNSTHSEARMKLTTRYLPNKLAVTIYLFFLVYSKTGLIWNALDLGNYQTRKKHFRQQLAFDLKLKIVSDGWNWSHVITDQIMI